MTLQTIQERRQGLHDRLIDGATGVEIVESFTDLIDGILIARYRTVARKGGQEEAVAPRALLFSGDRRIRSTGIGTLF